MVGGLDGVNPVVIGGGVVRRYLEDPLQQGNSLLCAFVRFASFVVSIAHSVGKEYLCLDIVRIFLYKLAPNCYFLLVVGVAFGASGFESIIGSTGSLDVELLRSGSVVFETDCGCQGLVGIAGAKTVTHDERLIESPVAHCALWIDADALLESALGFVLPKVV
jgi:hypothetical protein